MELMESFDDNFDWMLGPTSQNPSAELGSYLDAPPLDLLALGDSTGEAPASASKNKKRQRVVHPAFRSLGACDICRSRRVKCVRLNADDPTCEECRKKTLACTNKRNGGIRYKPRGFKTAGPAEVTSHSLVLASSASPSSHRFSEICPSGLENRLGLSEEHDSLMSQLMESYYATSSFSTPPGSWWVLKLRFEAVGRRPSALDPVTETIVMACITLGALHSDHPLILGAEAPRIDKLMASGSTADLSDYARRREPFCQRLTNQVVSMADRSGVFRDTNPESIAALALTSRLVLHMAGERNDATRPYLSSAIAHIQHARQSGMPDDEMSNSVSFALAVSDAFRSANRGLPFMVHEDELSGFLGLERAVPLSLSLQHLDMIANTISHDKDLFIVPVVVYWFSTIRYFRLFASEISIPLRQGQRVTTSDFRRNLDAWENVFTVCAAARGIAKTLEGLLPPSTIALQTRILGSPAPSFIQAVAFSHCAFLLLIINKFQIWKDAHNAVSVEDDDMEEEKSAIAAIERDLSRVTVDACLLIKDGLDGFKGSVQSLTAHMSMLTAVQYDIVKWTELVLAMKCTEDGGRFPKYTRAVKLDTCRSFIDAVRAQSWTWARRQVEAAALEAKYEQVVMEAANAAVTAAQSACQPFSNGAPSSSEPGSAFSGIPRAESSNGTCLSTPTDNSYFPPPLSQPFEFPDLGPPSTLWQPGSMMPSEWEALWKDVSSSCLDEPLHP